MFHVGFCASWIGWVRTFAILGIGSIAAISLPQPAAASSHTNETPDLPWSSETERPNQCCGTIAVSNLLILLDNDAGRVLGDATTSDQLQDEVEKETNDDTDKSSVSNQDILKGIEKILKRRGYTGIVESILQEGESALTFKRIVDEIAADERLLLLIETEEEGPGGDDVIGHWVTVTGVDKDKNTISVTDPNTAGNQSDNPRDPGTADTYAVDTSDLTFNLGYDFDGKSRVKVIDIIKVSDVTDEPNSPEETGGGASNTTGEFKEKSGESRLSFNPANLDSLFFDSSSPGGVDPAFSSDPILGASIQIGDLTLLNPADALTEGALLSGGTVEILDGGETLFGASFRNLTLIDSTQLGANQAILDDLFFNNTIGSDWLDAFAAQFAADLELLPQLFLQPANGSQSLLEQLGFLQSALSEPVSLGLFLGATEFVPTEVTEVRTVTGRNMATGLAIPEPASWLLLLMGLVSITILARSRYLSASR